MKRRYFISALGGAGLLYACEPTKTPPKPLSNPMIKWRMITSWPQSLDIIHGSLQRLVQRVEAMTEGRFTIELFSADEVVPALKVLDAVSDGTVEAGHTASYYYLGKQLAFAFATTLPFGLTPMQQNAWLYNGGGLEAIQSIYADFNIINFPAGNTGSQMGGWFKRTIQTPQDLQGLKMRIPGLGGEIMSRLGVNVQVIPGGEIFLALQRGALDAADWIGPYDDRKLGLHDAAKYYYAPGWWEPGATFDALVNRKAWNALPKNYQAIFKAAAYETNLTMLAEYQRKNQEAIAALKQDGIQILTYSPEILKAAQKISEDLYQEKSSQNPEFSRIFQQWNQFRTQSNQWLKQNTLPYSQFIAS